MDLRLPTRPSVIPSPEGTPMEPPKVRRESGQVGAYTEHSSRTSTSNDPWLLSQPLEVLQVTRKRTERSSPISSPMKLMRSPLPKVQWRLRTGTEQSYPMNPPVKIPQLNVRQFKALSPRGITLPDFLKVMDLQQELNIYMLHKLSVNNRQAEPAFLNIQDLFSVVRVTHTLRSHR